MDWCCFSFYRIWGGGFPLEVFFPSSRACWWAPTEPSGIGHIDDITWTPRQRVFSLAQNVILRAHKRHRLPQLQLSRIYCSNGEFSLFWSLSSFFLCLEHRDHEIQLFSRLIGIGVPFMGYFWRVKAAAGRRLGRFDVCWSRFPRVIQAAFLLRNGSFCCLWRGRSWHQSSYHEQSKDESAFFFTVLV